MHLLGFFYRLSPLRMVLATIAGAASGVVNVLFIATLTEFLRSRAGASSVWRFFLFCGLIVVARVASEWTLIALSQDLVHRLRLELCRSILQVPLRRLETLGSHPLLATLTEDINAITQAALSFPMLCTSAAVATGFLIYLASLSLLAFGVVIVVVSTGVAIYKAIARRAAVHVQLGRERTDTLMGHYRTLVNGSKELKLNVHRRRRLLAGLADTAAAVRQHVKDATMRYTSASVTTQALYFLLIASLAIVLPLVGLAGGGVLTGVVLALLSMRGSVESIVGVTPTLMRAEVSLRKIHKLGMSLADAAATDQPDGPDRQQSQAPFAALEFTGVSYAYQAEDGTAFALGPMTLRVRAGEVVFITGGNGSGKTTMAKLLTGLYVPDSGEVRVNGQLVTDQTREQYRGNFSAIFADFHLESELPGPATPAADERARELLGHLRLAHKVSVEGGRLSTVDLSQGQRKRLALLVALLEDRPVCLFDEWAADQDSTFRRFFYREILPGLKARGKTLLVISHDEQFYDAADRVIHLDEGRIRQDSAPEDGPHLAWAATGTTGRAASLAGAL